MQPKCGSSWSHMLSLSSKKYKNDFGIYHADALTVLKNESGSQSEQVKKNIQKIFKEHRLDFIIQCSMKTVNYLDVTFNLKDGACKPYTKPNNKIKYIHKDSNNRLIVIQQIPLSKKLSLFTLSFKYFKKHYPLDKKHSILAIDTLTCKHPKSNNTSTNVNKIK